MSRFRLSGNIVEERLATLVRVLHENPSPNATTASVWAASNGRVQSWQTRGRQGFGAVCSMHYHLSTAVSAVGVEAKTRQGSESLTVDEFYSTTHLPAAGSSVVGMEKVVPLGWHLVSDEPSQA